MSSNPNDSFSLEPSRLNSASRIEKLRKACNNCNSAKVRCSGEKSGCDRCNAAGVYCVYEPSRVGKVPGIRAKNRRSKDLEYRNRESGPHSSSRSPETLRQHRMGTALHTPPFSAQSTDGWIPDINDSNQFGPLSPSGMSGILDGTFDLEPPFPARSSRREHAPSMRPSITSSQPTSSAGTERQNQEMEMDFYSVASNSFQATGSSRDQALPRLAEKDSVQTRDETQPSMDSQCVLACAAIISKLETYIDAKIKVLDLTLDIVRKAVTSLSSIIDQGPTSRCCHMLLAAIMHQTVQILDFGCAAFLEKKDQASNSGTNSRGGLHQFDSVGGMLSGFGFGGFVDAGDERAWRARLALKEVRQVKESLKRVFHLAAQGSSNLSMPLETAEACNHDMISKLDGLISQFEKIQNS